MFSVIEKSTGQWVGRLGPWNPEGWPEPEVGWGISRAHWGKGYASEGAAAAMDYAFDVLGWAQVIHCIDPQNAGSIGVARKLGSRLLRRVVMPAPFEHVPMEAWGQSREEWRSRRQARLP
jgi:RimJ/RimL family protein N-acetyltransferase